MGSAVKAVTKPFEWVGKAASNVISSIGGLLTPKMPEIPAVTYTPPETPAEPAGPPKPPAEPAGPGASASESSEAQAERLRILASKAKKKTRTMLTSAQGIQNAAGVVKKKLLGE